MVNIETFRRFRSGVALACVGLVLATLLSARPGGAQETFPLATLVGTTHVHGIAFDPSDPTFLFIATHHGLIRGGPDGMAERISPVQDFMGFTPQPGTQTVLFASGHPAGGGNLGFIISTDGGRTWEQRSLGVSGPVDFHQMAASPVDPDVVFGVYGAIQMSDDAGRTWRVTGQAPPQMVDLAASAVSAETIYAATQIGLYVSQNAGADWRPLVRGTTVSLVEVAPTAASTRLRRDRVCFARRTRNRSSCRSAVPGWNLICSTSPSTRAIPSISLPRQAAAGS